jgi:signal peptidase I
MKKNLWNLLLVVLVLLVVCLITFRVITPCFGVNLKIVLSGSMAPTIPAGGIVVIKEISPEEIKVGDIATFWSGDESYTHRVIEIKNERGEMTFLTKGDANKNPDGQPVASANLMGRVIFHAPVVGYVLNIFTWPYLLWLPAVLALAGIIWAVYRLTEPKKKEGSG